MENKVLDTAAVRRMVGVSYKKMKILSESEADLFTSHRDEILQDLKGKVNLCSKGSKIYTGKLSEGCKICAGHAWACLFVNRLCTSNCFFCPQNRAVNKEAPPHDGLDINFNNPKVFIKYLKKFGYRGVGFSGGEPLLVLDTLLEYIRVIRKEFGKGYYIWLYTNGSLVNIAVMRLLNEAGLNEIRFNIYPGRYDLNKVALAKQFIKVVTVEIPAIPEDEEYLRKSLSDMRRIGVDHLNLHQLYATKANINSYINRNYTFLHHQCWPPVMESEFTALKIIRYAADNRIKLSINYCSSVFKRRFQGSSARKLFAYYNVESFETITENGFIRRLSAISSADNLKSLCRELKRNNNKKYFYFDVRNSIVHIHSSLLKYINLKKYLLRLVYYDITLKEGEGKEELTENREKVRICKHMDILVVRDLLLRFEPMDYLTGNIFKEFIKYPRMDRGRFIKQHLTPLKLLGKETDREVFKDSLEKIELFEGFEKIPAGLPKFY